MPYVPPTETVLRERQEAYLEDALRAWCGRHGRPVDPAALARAVRDPHGVWSILLRNNAMLLANAHRHLAWAVEQWFVDRATPEFVTDAHGPIWLGARRPATRARGRGTLTGIAGTVIPAGLELTVAGAAFVEVEVASVIGGGGTATVDLVAINPGDAANAPAGAVLPLVTPLIGLSAQAVTLDAGGLAGGAAAETVEAYRARILERIRAPAHGGAAFDYPTWIKSAFAVAHVAVAPILQRGVVRVVVAMGTREAPRAPNEAELEAMRVHLGRYEQTEGVRPVTAEVIMVPVTLRPISHRIAPRPDTTAVRQAIAAAITAFYASEATIGGTIELSRLVEAIASADGEYAHDLHAPASSVACGVTELAVPGALAWGPP
jgi:uncharacterized phage protein gp47/JayE